MFLNVSLGVSSVILVCLIVLIVIRVIRIIRVLIIRISIIRVLIISICIGIRFFLLQRLKLQYLHLTVQLNSFRAFFIILQFLILIILII